MSWAALWAVNGNIVSAPSKVENGARTSPTPLLAVIKEAIRLHAPFPRAFPRTITAGAEAAIPDLPAPLPVGTSVASNTYILGRSTEIWATMPGRGSLSSG
jgi:cytochrome P450